MLKSMLMLAPLLAGGAYAAGAFDSAPASQALPASGSAPAPKAAAASAGGSAKCPELFDRMRVLAFGSIDLKAEELGPARAQLQELHSQLRNEGCKIPDGKGGFDPLPELPSDWSNRSPNGTVSFRPGKPMVDLRN